MKRFIAIISLTFISVTFICAASLNSSSVNGSPQITMMLKALSTKGTTVGFSSTSINDTKGLTPITETQSLELDYTKEKDAEVTVSKTIYPYWVVSGWSVNVKLNWSVNKNTDIFTVTLTKDNSNSTLNSGTTYSIEEDATEADSVAINITTGDLKNKEIYNDEYILTFTLTAETT